MPVTITLADHEVARITQGLRTLSGFAAQDAELARDLGHPETAANHDDEAAACRLIVTRLTGGTLSPRLQELVDQANTPIDWSTDDETAASYYSEIASAFAAALTTGV